MRKFTLLFILVLIASTSFAQGIFTVNNNIGASANFDNLQTAVNDVPANSILLVHGSALSYGEVVVRKPLSIIGTGYFIGSNQAPYTQANIGTAQLQKLTISAGSNGSLVSGLTITSNLNIDSTSNVTISRNYIVPDIIATVVANSSNILFTQNFSNSAMSIQSTSITISNNIFVLMKKDGGLGYPFSFELNNSTNATFTNNIFDRLNSGSSILKLPNGSTTNFSNNIHLSKEKREISTICGSCPTGSLVATNNISSDSIFRNTNNAIINQSIESIFPQYNSSNSSLDSRYVLTSGSPAIGAGVGGIDVGVFAGTNSYVLSGIPFIPNIYGLEVPDIGTTGSGLKIRVKAQTNK
ncbi:MAG: hypothetical protein M9958_01905 [Chitinophagales bacterium]|nr:hypothetical protein [Chitinophagales bacterium]